MSFSACQDGCGIRLFGYALINFALFALKAHAGATGTKPAPEVWRVFSGHWMAFYSASLAILYTESIRTLTTASIRTLSFTKAAKDDLAVLPLDIVEQGYKLICVPAKAFTTNDWLNALGIDPGYEVFMVGRFISHEGKQKLSHDTLCIYYYLSI
jgi:hypothetical protein